MVFGLKLVQNLLFQDIWPRNRQNLVAILQLAGTVDVFLFSSDLTLWSQYKYIAFNILSCRILIISISYKMLIIRRIYNKRTNELTIYAILYQNVTIFYRQELASLFQVKEKFKAGRKSKWNVSNSCFFPDHSHVKILWLFVIVFSEQDTFHFWDNVHQNWRKEKWNKLVWLIIPGSSPLCKGDGG